MSDFFICPVCGTDVDVNAVVCPECGSDDETGWIQFGEANIIASNKSNLNSIST